MATNPYFNNFNSKADQGLIEDLFIESIKMFGQDMYIFLAHWLGKIH